MNSKQEEILESIINARKIAIAGHTNPDGDAIGACLALARLLSQKGKEVSVILEDYAPKYDMIPGREFVVQEKLSSCPDLFIALDCGDAERLGEAQELFSAVKNINIDHHMSNTYFGDLNYVDAKASSTSEIIYELFAPYFDVDSSAAAALYAGIIYDTGGFKHSSTGSRTMEIAACLIRTGIPFTAIYEKLFYEHTFSEAKLLGRAIERAQLIFEQKVIYSFISAKDIEVLDASSKELDSVIGYLKSVQGTKAAVFFYEKGENLVKVSFRGEDGLNVCAIAEKFGGGGHIKASGCSMETSMEDAINQVLKTVEEAVYQKEIL